MKVRCEFDGVSSDVKLIISNGAMLKNYKKKEILIKIFVVS